jgi:uncharacterized protein
LRRGNLRAVLDTNIFVAAFLSKSQRGPGRELLALWEQGAFDLLVSRTLATEIGEKLLARVVDDVIVGEFILLLRRRAIWIEVPTEAVLPILQDPDDNHVLACAVVGQADYLVTHDRHFDAL